MQQDKTNPTLKHYEFLLKVKANLRTVIWVEKLKVIELCKEVKVENTFIMQNRPDLLRNCYRCYGNKPESKSLLCVECNISDFLKSLETSQTGYLSMSDVRYFDDIFETFVRFFNKWNTLQNTMLNRLCLTKLIQLLKDVKECFEDITQVKDCLTERRKLLEKFLMRN